MRSSVANFAVGSAIGALIGHVLLRNTLSDAVFVGVSVFVLFVVIDIVRQALP